MPQIVSDFFPQEKRARSSRLFRYIVTRVTPVGNGGKFSKEAREIYSLVLKMQTVRYSTIFLTSSWVLTVVYRRVRNWLSQVCTGTPFISNVTRSSSKSFFVWVSLQEITKKSSQVASHPRSSPMG